MTSSKDMNSQERVLAEAIRMVSGEKISVKAEADKYGVSKRTILRDISAIKHSLDDKDVGNSRFFIKYDSQNNDYQLFDEGILTSPDALRMLLSLLDNNVRISSDEFSLIQKSVIQLVASDQRKSLNALLLSAYKNYEPTLHKEDAFERLQQLLNGIINYQTLEFTYNGVTNKGVPLSVFSEKGTFYVLMYVDDEYKDMSYQIDKIKSIKNLGKEIVVPNDYWRSRLNSEEESYIS